MGAGLEGVRGGARAARCLRHPQCNVPLTDLMLGGVIERGERGGCNRVKIVYIGPKLVDYAH